jgi:hypothetical protein
MFFLLLIELRIKAIKTPNINPKISDTAKIKPFFGATGFVGSTIGYAKLNATKSAFVSSNLAYSSLVFCITNWRSFSLKGTKSVLFFSNSTL